jgi:anti-sigma factor RsiW
MEQKRSVAGDGERDIHAYLDGELGPDEAAEVEERLRADPEEMARFETYARHKALLQEAGREAPGPTDLRTAQLARELAGKLDRRAAPSRDWPDWKAAGWRTAAAVALVASGWFGHAQFAPGSGPHPTVAPTYVAEAVGAHRVFADDYIKPAEFGPDLSPETVSWISTKLGRSVKVPSLEPIGLQLVGARLMGTAAGPIAYFLYENTSGDRVSLTMSRHPDGTPALDFASYSEANRQIGYWSAGPLDYALVAPSGEHVHRIAAQLNR